MIRKLLSKFLWFIAMALVVFVEYCDRHRLKVPARDLLFRLMLVLNETSIELEP
jgi:hypothetical protein